MKEDEILARELGKLGARLGSRREVEWVARRLPADSSEVTLDIGASPSEVLKAAVRILSQLGRVMDRDESLSDLPCVVGVMGSGVGNMNPAIVRVEVAPVSECKSRVFVRGTAKEGLIKQRAGEKAARKVAGVLSEAFAPPALQD